MPLPVIADTFRITVQYDTVFGVTPHNVMHFRSDTGNEASLAAAIDDRFSSNMIACLHTTCGPTSYDVIKLDGVSSMQTFGATTAATGGGTGDIVPAVAYILNLRTLQRGPRGRGRVFIGPATEGMTAHGMTITETRTTMQTAWQTFITGMAGEPGAWEMVIASYAHSDANGVTSLGIRQAVGTMRRRQDQLVS